MHFLTRIRAAASLTALAVLPAGTAQANIVLSQVVVDIAPGADTAQDIEIANPGTDVTYVVVEPSEIVAPGLPTEKRVAIVDPATGGLLVTPQRLILQPGERKTIRVAAVAERSSVDRVYRVTVKPVAGPVSAPVTALKLLVGYDVLVIYRPAAPTAKVSGDRAGNGLTLHNQGNTNVELFEGKQCETAQPATCKPLPSRRLYAGQSWQQVLSGTGPITYRIATGSNSSVQTF